MAQGYGDRWELLRSIAQGGQAQVFAVRDLQGRYSADELVLKRVGNPKRHARFRSEVSAIGRLNHPNIIRLIDHSALVLDDLLPEHQYIVMPHAKEGRLGARAALYENNPRSFLTCACWSKPSASELCC